jgi:hypothetical protein
MTDTTQSRYRSWPIEPIVRDNPRNTSGGATGLCQGERDMLIFSIAVSLKRIGDALEGLGPLIAVK